MLGIILKLKPKKLEINALGLSIAFEGIGKDFKGKIIRNKTIISMAGPLVNLIIVVLASFSIFGDSSLLILYVNLILLMVNLIPIYPLDGGRIIKNILHTKYRIF